MRLLPPCHMLIYLLASLASQVAAADPIHFGEQISPIIRQHCLRCHSPAIRQGEVSLATFDDLRANDFVLPGDPEGSHLLDLVTSSGNEPPAMPKDGEPLSEKEVARIREWIVQGADWPADVVIREKSKADATWWSLQPLRPSGPQSASSPSESASTERPRSKIDEFILARLAEQGLTLSPPADRRTLIRRATYDLLGLPPTPQEVAAFENDTDPRAYELLIDRLLESPHYGERWGRHWLDVVRFGESIGFERNVIVNELWPFRDYVIRSLNDDKPFDQFIREHLAGDVIAENGPDVAVGSAFLVAGPYDDVGNQDAAQAAQIRANTLDEIISATGQAFLGMTLGCARCHDHKFDPITQQDYYGLYATFAGIRHGSVPLATEAAKQARDSQVAPLNKRKAELEAALRDLKIAILERAKDRFKDYEANWTRPPVQRAGTEEQFAAVLAKFVRLVCESQDDNPARSTGFGIDEFEVWSEAGSSSSSSDSDSSGSGAETASLEVSSSAVVEPAPPVNVALAANGGKATGKARDIEDFPGAYGPQLAIDGKFGARFISVGSDLTIELALPTRINRVVFSSARNEDAPEQPKFVFVADYRIEISLDGEHWSEVASGRDRRPVGTRRELIATQAVDSPDHLEYRLLQSEITEAERSEEKRLRGEIAEVNRQIAQVPGLQNVWIGTRVANDAAGPFHVFLGGSPQKLGEPVVPASLSALSEQSNPAGTFSYRLPADSTEAERRQALASWIVHPRNPLTARVLANRLWHYHFGTGIVDTPSDFGYMGGRPTHPELLDYLATQLLENNWQIKALHRMIMTSETYCQSSDFNAEAAKLDGDARLLWRFPPRRLSAEEIRDTILQVAGKLDPSLGGPGFRLYHFMQDNVCTYVPLDEFGPETFRRAVYHQNARASVVDLMTDFDQPDCAFSTPRRSETVTPLQALTMLNHSFTLQMADAMAERLAVDVGDDRRKQVERAYELCYSRAPSRDESRACLDHIENFGLAALCRILLNTSELIHVD